MQMVVLLHEEYVRQAQHDAGHDQVDPVRQQRVRAQEDESERDRELDAHVDAGHRHVAHPQFIGHELIGMFAVRLSQPLMQHEAMHDGQVAVHAVQDQQDQVRHVPGLHDQLPQREEQDERHTDAAHVAGEAARLALRAEIEEAEHQHAQHRYDEIRLLDEAKTSIQQRQRRQHHQRVSGRHAVDAVHEVDDIECAAIHDQRDGHEPPQLPAQDAQAAEHKQDRHELHHQPEHVRQRLDVIPEAHPRDHQQADEERPIAQHRLAIALEQQHHAPDDHREGENHSAAAPHVLRVRAALVRFVNDLEVVRYLEVQDFCREQHNE